MSNMNAAALSALAKGDFDNARVASTPGGIEQQEREGQTALVSNFTRLPKDFGYNKEFPTALLERLGFKIGVPIDELFVAVEAPAGWRLRATDHAMHSDIVDDQGRERGGIFYKAAFYDRKANCYLNRRYAVHDQHDNDGKDFADWKQRVYLRDGADGTHILDYDWRKANDYTGLDTDRENGRAEMLKR